MYVFKHPQYACKGMSASAVSFFVVVQNVAAMIPGTTSSPRKVTRIVPVQRSRRSRFCAFEKYRFCHLLFVHQYYLRRISTEVQVKIKKAETTET